MCRLFAVLSKDPVQTDYYLKQAPQSLIVQSAIDKRRLQGDGWGVGWFEQGKPKIVKSPAPLYRDADKVRDALRKARGSVVLGHVRWASNPLKLSRQELIGSAHTQPFKHGDWLFVHNGTLYIPREVKAELGPWAKYVKGRNDSEVLFYWLLKTVIHGKGNWAARVRHSLRALDKIWSGCRTKYPIYKHPSHGLNWVLTNGRDLIAFCYVNSKGFDQSKALGSNQPYFQLQIKQTSRECVIASQPLANEPGWTAFKHGQLLVTRRSSKGIHAQRYQVVR